MNNLKPEDIVNTLYNPKKQTHFLKQRRQLADRRKKILFKLRGGSADTTILYTSNWHLICARKNV